MAQHGKKMLEAYKKFEKSRRYELRDALQTGEGYCLCQIR